ncbi:MAG: NAD(P)-binding protein [Pseudomonadota bacterium]
MAKQKIAIVGGGVGGMSTAIALTNQPGWQDKYEITLYQMGFRLGGKGASGRGPDGRIQEHGLHIWLGFYENAFRAMNDAFGELQDDDRVYRSIEEAFESQNLIGVMENVDGDWRPFIIDYPTAPGVPGDGTPKHHDSVWEVMTAAMRLVGLWIEKELGFGHEGHEAHAAHLAEVPEGHESRGGFLHWLVHQADELWDDAVNGIEDLMRTAERGFLQAAYKIAQLMPSDWTHLDDHKHGIFLSLLERERDRLKARFEASARKNDTLRRMYMIVDLMLAAFRGLIANRREINKHGLGVLDDMDFQEFFEKYGCDPINCQVEHSAPVRGFYDLVFGYENGDTTRPNFAAGVAMRSAICILMLYKQSIFMKMRAGMGDTIFAPMHKALEKRGVKFEFFHVLEDMEPAEADGQKVVGKLKFQRQATLKGDSYQPYVVVDHLDCWPQAPLVDQLVEGEEILKGPDGEGTEGWDGNWKGYDLEDFWTTWKGVGTVELERGKDFDLVVLAIPPSSHPFLAQKLIDLNPDWQNMVEKVGTVRTQAMQLWLKADLPGLGWDHGSIVIDAFQQPMNTWSDMTHLINREAWPISASPASIAYFCGPMVGGIPDPSETGVQKKAADEVSRLANTWLESAPGVIWPKGSTDGALDLDTLVQGTFKGGEGRLKGQYWRANVSPTERYVMSLKGSTSARLGAAGSGFGNLFFAGDWTDNGFNAGCVEASVMSGLYCSQAISGAPEDKNIETYW